MTMMTAHERENERKYPKRRRFMRYAGNPLDVAEIDFQTADKPFKPERVALVFQEAYGGCGLILHNRENLEVDFYIGRKVRLKLGKLGPIEAETVWTKTVGDDVLKVGFKFPD